MNLLSELYIFYILHIHYINKTLKGADVNMPRSKNHQRCEGYVRKTQKRRAIYNKQRKGDGENSMANRRCGKRQSRYIPKQQVPFFTIKRAQVQIFLFFSLSFTLSISITVLPLSSIFHRRPSTIDHQFTSNHPPLFTLFTPTLSHDVSAPGSTSRPRKPSGSPDIRMLVLSNQLDWIFWPPLPPRRRSLCQARSYSHPRL